MLRDILTNEYLSRLEVLDMSIRKRLSAAPSSGARKSSSKGSSIEFSDFREYAQGDDLRRVDWNSYARFGRLYTKLFNEERQASINIILDGSTSMRLFEKKLDFAQAVAASVAYIALNNSDKVNIFIADGMNLEKCTGLVSKQAFSRCVNFIAEERKSGETFLNKFSEQLANERLGDGVSVIISDFFSDDGYDKAVKLLKGKKQNVIMVQILDFSEVEPQEKGNVRLIDSETDAKRELEITPEVVDRYKKALDNYRNELREFAVRNETAFYSFDTSMPIMAAVGEIIK